MVLGLRVETTDSLSTRLTTTVERAVTPETRGVSDADAYFSQSFVRQYTDFESLDAFCRICPCDRDTVGGVQRLSADERDAFVADTTDFETWLEMKQRAAVTDLVTLATA